MQFLGLESVSGLIITHDKSCETKASSPMDFLCPPQGQVRSKCCVWDVQHGSHQAPFPPFKHIKTSLQLLPFCESPGFLQTPLLMGYKGLWKGFVSSVYQEVTWFPPHHLFLL